MSIKRKIARNAGVKPADSRFLRVEPWQNRVATLMFVLLVCVLPLNVSSARYVGLTGYKFRFFFSSMCIVLAWALAVWCFRLLGRPRLLIQEKLSVADWAVLGFAAVTLLSAILSPFHNASIASLDIYDFDVWTGMRERHDGAITQLMYVAAFLIAAKWYKPHQCHFALFGISAALISLIGILQFFGMDFLNLWPNHRYGYANLFRIPFRTTLGNINIVSTYACVSAVLCGFLFVNTDSKRQLPWRLPWLFASALCFWLLILARSVSGLVGTVVAVAIALPFIILDRRALGLLLTLISSWLGVYALHRLLYEVNTLEAMTAQSLLPFAIAAAALLAAGLALLLVKFGKARAPAASARWRLGLILLAAFIVGGLAVVEFAGRNPDIHNSRTAEVLYPAREIMHGNIDDDMGSGRIYMWRIGLESFPNHPIIGTGPDTYAFAIPEDAHYWNGPLVIDKAHNEYLQILVCQGILGLLCYLVFLGAVLFKAVPKTLGNPLVMALTVAFIGYCVQAFFNISTPIASQILWVLAGLMANKHVLEFNPQTDSPPDIQLGRRAKQRASGRARRIPCL